MKSFFIINKKYFLTYWYKFFYLLELKTEIFYFIISSKPIIILITIKCKLVWEMCLITNVPSLCLDYHV